MKLGLKFLLLEITIVRILYIISCFIFHLKPQLLQVASYLRLQALSNGLN
jgi:accessory gene regulator protein AgrB